MHNPAMIDENASAPAARKTLVLVDGSSYLYRAFFAGGDAMSTTLPDGTVLKTGAIRGMINMMQSCARRSRPITPPACSTPRARPSAMRSTRSTRPSAPPCRMTCAPRSPIHEVVRLLGWTVLDVPGVEADDVIGTLAVTAARRASRS
jgi:DNA polymerase-1